MIEYISIINMILIISNFFETIDRNYHWIIIFRSKIWYNKWRNDDWINERKRKDYWWE